MERRKGVAQSFYGAAGVWLTRRAFQGTIERYPYLLVDVFDVPLLHAHILPVKSGTGWALVGNFATGGNLSWSI